MAACILQRSQSFDAASGSVVLLLNSSIAEETSVEIADTSYSPLSSPDEPLSENIPVEVLETPLVATTSAPPDVPSPASLDSAVAATLPDLDAQIEELNQKLSGGCIIGRWRTTSCHRYGPPRAISSGNTDPEWKRSSEFHLGRQ